MINKDFNTVFQFLVDSLNSLQADINKKNIETNKVSELRRLQDAIVFIHSKHKVLTSDLTSFRQELEQMLKDAGILKTKINHIPSAHRCFNCIQNLIMELDAEISNRKNTDNTTKESDTNKEKIKIFRSSNHESIENQINDFLSKNKVDIVRTMQTTDNHMITITIFYK